MYDHFQIDSDYEQYPLTNFTKISLLFIGQNFGKKYAKCNYHYSGLSLFSNKFTNTTIDVTVRMVFILI